MVDDAAVGEGVGCGDVERVRVDEVRETLLDDVLDLGGLVGGEVKVDGRLVVRLARLALALRLAPGAEGAGSEVERTSGEIERVGDTNEGESGRVLLCEGEEVVEKVAGGDGSRGGLDVVDFIQNDEAVVRVSATERESKEGRTTHNLPPDWRPSMKACLPVIFALPLPRVMSNPSPFPSLSHTFDAIPAPPRVEQFSMCILTSSSNSFSATSAENSLNTEERRAVLPMPGGPETYNEGREAFLDVEEDSLACSE